MRPASGLPVILSRKISAPSVPTDMLVRKRLRELYFEYSGLPITLIQAQAGFGKSYLMSSWVEEVQGPYAWVSLDAEDGALDRFWAYLLGALAQEELIDQKMIFKTKNLQSHEDALSLVDEVLYRLEEHSENIVLFIEDYHNLCNDSPVHQSFLYFIMHMPLNVRIIMSTRTYLNLGLSKLQAQGLMGKITEEDLRFTPEEVESYCSRSKEGLSVEDARSIYEYTHGWAVAMKLFAISGDYHGAAAEVRSYIQAREIVGNYLFEEVINDLDEQLYEFLAATCCLTSFSLPLAQQILEADEERILSSLRFLVENNLFVTKAVGSNGVVWYRYQELFAEAALQYFINKNPACILISRTKALLWYEENSLLDEAVKTAALLDDYDTIRRFILDYWSRFCIDDNYVRLMHWFEYLPPGYIEDHTDLAAIESLPLALTGNIDLAVSRIHEAERSLVHKDDELFGFVMGFKAIVSCVQSDNLETRRLSELALTYLSDKEVYLMNINLQVAAGSYSDKPEKAIDIFEKSLLKRDAILRNETFRYSVQSSLCVLNSILGNYAESEKWAQKVLDAYPVDEHPEHPIFLYCYVARMNMAYLKADLPTAEANASYALKHAYDCWTPVLIAQVHGFKALTAYLSDDLAASKLAASESLSLSPLGFARNYPSLIALSYWFKEGILTWESLARGDKGETAEPIVWVGAALEYLEQNYSGIDTLIAYSETIPTSRRLAKMEFALLIALYYEALAQQEQADSWFAECLRIIEELGVSQACFENAPLVQELLKRQVELYSHTYAAKLYKTLPSRGFKKNAAPPEHSELTMREKEIMGLVCEGLSTKEIAQTLFISYETAKKHIANCYQKLGAHTRVQAVSLYDTKSKIFA